MKEENKKILSDKNLEDVAGGGVKEQVTAGVLGISALVSPIGIPEIDANAKSLSTTAITQNAHISDEQENLSLVKYLVEPKISEAQEKAFKITDDLTKKNDGDHKIVSRILSSYRYTKNAKPTDLEKGLDEDVKNGDLPIPDFTVAAMQKTKSSVVDKNKKSSVKFVLFPNLDALHLHETDECQDGDIVNLASQFNALESVSNEPSPVKIWYMDRTQGPYCALQAVAATKHREAAHLQGKLADGLKEALEYCKIDGKPITEKYPDLYKNGYLEMMEITDEKDMEQFLAFLEDEENLAKHMKVLMQWVKCEGTGKKQLQFFTAAPSFQSYNKGIWLSDSKIMELRRKACVKLVEIQYRAMAQAAAIISEQNGGKNVRLHVTMVGHGVFNNPIDTVPAALKALKEELQGTNATVFLHLRPGKGNIWEKGNLKELGIDLESLEKWRKKNK